MARIAGPRTSTDPREHLTVVVYRRWPWQKDEFIYEGEIGVNINDGVLTISLPDYIVSYAPRKWRRVVSEHTHA